MKIFKELNKLGYKHYAECTIEELDNLPLNSEERILEQALVLRWFREKYNFDVGIAKDSHDIYHFQIDTNYYSNWILPIFSRIYEEAELECLKKLIEIVKEKYIMKNIHVIQTDKPSRLLKDLVDGTYQFKKEVLYGNRFELPLNIYITNSEEIKDCYYFNSKDNAVRKNNNLNHPYHHKIILTTDQDLIKDGIEQISEDVLLKIVEHINSGKNIESFDEL